MSYQPPSQPGYPYPQQPPQFPQPTPKQPWYQRLFAWMRRHPIATVIIMVVLIVVGVISNLTSQQTPATTKATSTATTQPTSQPTPTPTAQPTAKVTPTQPLAPIPSAAELSGLLSSHDGKVTDVNVTPNSDGTKNVAVDVLVNNPTQTKVKHITYILMQFFFGERNDVTLLNLAFHANGYTGADDPIAGCGGVASEYKLGYDENQLWNAMAGVFNADLPA